MIIKVAKQFKEQRQRFGFSQKQLADCLKVSVDVIKNIETARVQGMSYITLSGLVSIGFDLNDIFGMIWEDKS